MSIGARPRQPVLALLMVGLLVALLALPFIGVAPNRLLSARGVALLAVPGGWVGPVAAAALLLAAWFVAPRRALHGLVVLAAGVLFAGSIALAGHEAARRTAELSPLARVSLGGGLWIALLLIAAAAADALRRLELPRAAHALAVAAFAAAPLWLLTSGALDALSLLKEHANRREVFDAALLRHLQIVGGALLAALLVGVPVGLAAARRPRLARPLFALLNLVQTIPSIALFGLLIGPLAWLGQAWPESGIRGIGLLPALIALSGYALLPIVHGIVSGLGQVPAAALDAAVGSGMSRRQCLLKIELPLALPLLLSALRLTTVQLTGLAVVAALIGAGGLGALVFQGLLGSALDLVLLGVVPALALAALFDAGFALAQRAVEPVR